MLNGYKTYLAAIAALLVAIGYCLQEYLSTGNIAVQAVISAFIALALLFLRQGIKKEEVK
jgi:hypothetical protein